VKSSRSGARCVTLPPEKGQSFRPPLTPTQLKILNIICNYIRANAQPPSHRTVAKLAGRSVTSTFYVIASLKEKGYLAGAGVGSAS
jgi:hypothetical protein